MTVKKLVSYAGLAFVIFYAIVFTDSAVAISHGVWNDTVSVAHGIGQFINRLSGSKSSAT